MEPTPIGSGESFPVDITKICQGLKNLAIRYGLINFKVTNMLTLEAMTADLIKDSRERCEPIDGLLDDIAKIWFPSMFFVDSGGDLHKTMDIQRAILSCAGYPDEEKDALEPFTGGAIANPNFKAEFNAQLKEYNESMEKKAASYVQGRLFTAELNPNFKAELEESRKQLEKLDKERGVYRVANSQPMPDYHIKREEQWEKHDKE